MLNSFHILFHSQQLASTNKYVFFFWTQEKYRSTIKQNHFRLKIFIFRTMKKKSSVAPDYWFQNIQEKLHWWKTEEFGQAKENISLIKYSLQPKCLSTEEPQHRIPMKKSQKLMGEENFSHSYEEKEEFEEKFFQ